MRFAQGGKMKAPRKFLTLLLAILLTALAIVTPLSPVLAAATVVVGISPSSGPPGAVLYVYGTGCTATSTFTVYFGTTAITSGIVPTGGIISTWFGVPVLPRGAYDVTISTNAPDTTLSPGVFIITPQVFLSTTSGSSGDQLIVSGNGFYPSSAITIYFDGVAQTPTTTVYSDYYGQFGPAAIAVPQTYGGAHTVTASDYYGVSPGATYTITPKVTLSASTGAVGSSVTVSGTGFAASSALSFFIDSTAISVSASTNSTGNFSNVALVIPATYGGAHTIKAQDASNNSVTAAFSVTAAMTIGPNTGPVDTSVAITGKGFLASSAITITFDGANVTTTSSLTSDANGSFNANIKVPASSSGSHVITVSDGTNSISANFTVVATASIGPTSGPVATTITTSGSGFKGNGKITITYNSVQVGTATANATGSFTTTFAIPSASTGAHSLVITDQTNTQTFSFSVIPTATISPTSGYVGSDITINGTGFGANKGVTVKYDADQVTSSTTDANGTFTASFKAPISIGGNHQITVTDGTSTSTFKFTMDSTPPLVSTLSLPATLTKLGKIPTLAWTEVKDPSGVTYTMQISKDAAFSTLTLQKQGLTTPSYTLNKQNPQEKLKSASKSAPYYWRVKAIDAASNESAWSTPQTFLVGLAIGEWAIYIVFAVVAILLGVGGFLLGRLAKRRA
jgi:hypothetical protein